MSHGCVDIRIGATYSNDLGPRYVEHRRVTGMDGGFVQYEITHGKRTGATGACTPPAFWCWQRLLVADAANRSPDASGGNPRPPASAALTSVTNTERHH